MDYLLNIGPLRIAAFVVTDILNLIINGLPSKHRDNLKEVLIWQYYFKPYYKWITF